MASIRPDPATRPVVCDDQQLQAYLAAYANGTPHEALEGLRMERSAWLQRSGPGGDAAWHHAEALDLPLVDFAAIERVGPSDERFPSLAARRLNATALLEAHGYLAVAIDAGTDASMVAMLDFVANEPVVPLVATADARRGGAAPHDHLHEDHAIALQMGLEPGRRAAERAARDQALATRSPLVQTMRGTLAAAVSARASDVHIRPGPDGCEVLFRIDDNMVPQRGILPEVAAVAINRIKVFAGLNIAEHRRPQDGRGSFQLPDGRSIDVRVSVVPTVQGESVVIRLLDNEESLKGLDDIQLSPADRAAVDEQMARTHGLFLATGPTGCGKSTTLYAMLQALRARPINILTVEDPVEYTLPGVRQVETNEAVELSFANVLRSFLRHDPDVIMVGEIRDAQTARMAIESALTGHLVLSTLHTTTAATSVTRLLELGVESYLLRAALGGVISQRLVRLTCEHCRTAEDPPPAIRAALRVGPDEAFTVGRGCPHCHGTGVFRRSAVYELMRVTPAIRDLIEPGVHADRLHAAALEQGMVPITAAAVQMARDGRISLAEAYRVRVE